MGHTTTRCGERTRQRQEQQHYHHDRTSSERNLGIGQPLFLKNFGTGHRTSSRWPHSEKTLKLPSKPGITGRSRGVTEALFDRTQQHTSQRQDPGQESIDMQEAERPNAMSHVRAELVVSKGQPRRSRLLKPVRNNAVSGRRSTRRQRGLQRSLERSPQSGDHIESGELPRD